MKLHLRNPLAFFDLETTGIMVSQDRIIELAILKVLPNGTKELKAMRAFAAKKPIKKLYGTFYDALGGYRSSKFLQDIMGNMPHEKIR